MRWPGQVVVGAATRFLDGEVNRLLNGFIKPRPPE